MDDISNFKEWLAKERELAPENIEESVKIVLEFKDFLKKKGKDVSQIKSDDFFEFSNILIVESRNTEANYVALVRYGVVTKNTTLIKLGIEVLDGTEVMPNLYKRLKKEFSKEFRDEIFEGTELPPLGIDPKIKPNYTKKLISRLQEKTDEKTCEKFLAKGLRDSYYQSRRFDRYKFLKAKNIDDFLKQIRERHLNELEKHKNEGTLYYTQEVNDEVLEYAQKTPTIEGGVREGNILRVTKIPYQTIQYLNATDSKMKAYSYCHCPWVREAILDGTADEIPTVFCNCSGGYYKAYWEIVLKQPIEVDTVKTVLKGDPFCEFHVHLPEEIVKNLE